MQRKNLKFLELNEKRLSQQWVFRLAIAIPFTISFFLCIPLWFETTFDFSSTGYAKFLSMFSLPIGVLSLSIPLVAIVAHIHRTIQTEVQIQESRGKNIPDSFFSHHKYFMEAFSKIPPFSIKINTSPNRKVIDEYKSEIKSPIKLYYSLFKNSSYTNGINNISFLEEINKIKEKIKEINTNLDKEIIELKSIHEIKNIANEIKKIKYRYRMCRKKHANRSICNDEETQRKNRTSSNQSS
ncbi:hypothetical protein SOV88_19620 [Pectobacterium brasiliense]|uniref:hypothetical protein n=1 Tax=Pectobacterium brasiliense TaxID=180957 RepID=UPI002A7EBCEA|nr:hypothetical protein [Pectobacterium brasiliense]MDY4326471.1 hypothetical protein [Pectobacterium brasiliense]